MYYGYKNYETHSVCAWFDNKYYDDGCALAKECLTDVGGDKAQAISCLMDLLKEKFRELFPLPRTYDERSNPYGEIYFELLQCALDNVEWYDVAKRLIENVTWHQGGTLTGNMQ